MSIKNFLAASHDHEANLVSRGLHGAGFPLQASNRNPLTRHIRAKVGTPSVSKQTSFLLAERKALQGQMQPQPELPRDSGNKEAGGPPAGTATDTDIFKPKSILASSTRHLPNRNFL